MKNIVPSTLLVDFEFMNSNKQACKAGVFRIKDKNEQRITNDPLE